MENLHNNGEWETVALNEATEFIHSCLLDLVLGKVGDMLILVSLSHV